MSCETMLKNLTCVIGAQREEWYIDLKEKQILEKKKKKRLKSSPNFNMKIDPQNLKVWQNQSKINNNKKS